MSDLKPLLALGRTVGIERTFGEADSELATRILAEIERLQGDERSARRKRRLIWALRAAVAAAGFGFVGF